jgi:hypothetical protein
MGKCRFPLMLFPPSILDALRPLDRTLTNLRYRAIWSAPGCRLVRKRHGDQIVSLANVASNDENLGDSSICLSVATQRSGSQRSQLEGIEVVAQGQNQRRMDKENPPR